MSPIKATIWELKPHTQVKHIILRMYLDAWLPILTSWNKRVLYIDGFAGPGKYKGGEDGSPIIAIKAVKEHKTKIESEIVMLFIEKESDRCSYLKNKIKSMYM